MKEKLGEVCLIVSVVLIFLSMVSIVHAERIGYENIGNRSDATANRIRGTWFTVEKRGQVDNITGYFRAGAANWVKFAIYDENFELLAESEETSNVLNGAWITLDVPAEPIINANENIFLACWIDTRGAALAYDSAGNSGKNDNYTYDGFPSSLSLAELDRIYSIYACTTESESLDFEILETENITTNSAVLRGHIITDGNPDVEDAWFRWKENGTTGWSDSYLDKVSITEDNVYFSHTVSNLNSGTTYVAQVVVNQNETFYPEFVSEKEYFMTKEGMLQFNDTLKTSATIFNRNEIGTIYAQLLDNSNNPANDENIELTIYDNDKNVYDTGYMTNIADSSGIYVYNFTTPVELGVYVVDAVAVRASDNAYSSSTFQVQEFEKKDFDKSAKEIIEDKPDKTTFGDITEAITKYIPETALIGIFVIIFFIIFFVLLGM